MIDTGSIIWKKKSHWRSVGRHGSWLLDPKLRSRELHWRRRTSAASSNGHIFSDARIDLSGAFQSVPTKFWRVFHATFLSGLLIWCFLVWSGQKGYTDAMNGESDFVSVNLAVSGDLDGV
jgi:hypothetical protein